MAHLGSSYSSYNTFLNGADAFWTLDLAAMNNSGVTGDVLLAVNTEEDGTRYLNVSINAAGLTPNVQHAQHIHGTFDEDGNPTDARMPVVSDDADQDGFIEVLEGLAAYGDIILTLTDGDGVLPTTRSDGTLTYIQSFDLGDDSNFGSPVSGNDYTADDLMPLVNREIVLHGQNVGAGFGAGTEGEIDGTQDGFVGFLPVASGEIEMTTQEQALDILEDQFERASDFERLRAGDDIYDAGLGDDTVYGGSGSDRIRGGADDDMLFGRTENDVLRGDDGADHLVGNQGQDRLFGGDGGDHLYGNLGADDLNGGQGNDMLFGNQGNDALNGGAGRDMLSGQKGDDVLTGGNGGDVLSGGQGWDEFVYNDLSEGNDTITDFEDGMDLISLSNLGLDFDDLAISSANDGSDALVEFGTTSILLNGVTVGELDQSDFVF
ncbi:calcium-binding protein [Donghicola sp. XS_ASV15]|uniref:calcium-binding protein n=1 Tax=Donghicola sp. XS_ASV15 TaxID=3241295 RepID=UPI003519BD62